MTFMTITTLTTFTTFKTFMTLTKFTTLTYNIHNPYDTLHIRYTFKNAQVKFSVEERGSGERKAWNANKIV